MKTEAILIVFEHYLPGHKAGGPVRSIANLVECLGHEFDFRILTSDRDLGDAEPYVNVETCRTQAVGHASVTYLRPRQKSLPALLSRLLRQDYGILYVNSFFSRLGMKMVFMRWARLIPRHPLVVAPRGEFSSGALALKPLRKRAYLWIAKRIGLYRDATWQASSGYERADLLRVWGPGAANRVVVAPDVVDRAAGGESEQGGESQPDSEAGVRPTKVPGQAAVVFLSRISPMKNLETALQVLSAAHGSLLFDIYGPIEDQSYWSLCEDLIRGMSSHVKVAYRGGIPHHQVLTVLRKYHLLLLPTRGENFGHVILEALSAGCPVLISDRTPWRGLRSQRAGWDVPLERLDDMVTAVDEMVRMGQDEFFEWSAGASALAKSARADTSAIQANRRLFAALLGQSV